MLIHVDPSAIDDAAGEGATAKTSRACLENLLRAHSDGQHLLSMAPEDVLRLAKVEGRFSEHAVSVLERIEAEAPAIAGLRGSVRWHLVVGLDEGSGVPSPARAGDGHILWVGLHHFERFERALRTILLGESPADTQFYVALAEVFLAVRHRSDVCLAYERRSGGGDQLAVELENAASTRRLLFAIADSDRRFPGGPPGKTWQRAQPIAASLPPFQRAQALPVRMVENLVPLAVYEAAFAIEPRNRHHLPVLVRLKDLRDVLDHAHLKHGLRVFQIIEEMVGEEKTFWHGVASRLDRLACRSKQGLRKGQERACQDEDERATCSCFVVESLGPDALRAVIAWMDRCPSPRRIAQLFKLQEPSSLTELCEELVAWGCAANEIST